MYRIIRGKYYGYNSTSEADAVSSCHLQHQQAGAFAAPPPTCDSRQTRPASSLWSQVPRLKRASTGDAATCTSSKPPFHPAVGSKRGLDFLASPPPNSVGCLSAKRTLDLATTAPRDHNNDMSVDPVLAPHRPPARPVVMSSIAMTVAIATGAATAPHPSPPPVLPAFRAKKVRRHCGGSQVAANAAAAPAFFSPSSFPPDPSSPTFRRANSTCAALDLGECGGTVSTQKQVSSNSHRAVPALFRSASAPLPPPNLLGVGLDAMDEDGCEDDETEEEGYEDWRNPLAAMVSETPPSAATTSAARFPPRLFAARHGSTASSAAPGTPPSATVAAVVFGRMQVDATPPPLTPPITAASAPAAEMAAAAAGGAARQMLTAAAATQSPDSCRILAAFADADAFGRLKRQMELVHLN
ncbi:hypothetical protein HK405_010530, partial [Cladochytrium tenue]